MRLIDADALESEVLYEEDYDYDYDENPIENYQPVEAVRLSEIKNAPTVDAEPVVRCRECKHFYGEPGQPNIQCGQMHVEDFCSYGERRNSNK